MRDLHRQNRAPRVAGLTVALSLALAAGCLPAGEADVVTLRTFPLDAARRFRAEGQISPDPLVSWDGRGSVRVVADSALVAPIVEVVDLMDVGEGLLVYEAKVRTRELDGLAYLEIRCRLSGRGEFYSRGLREPLAGSNGWKSQQVRFRVQPGEVPESLRLNLVLTGRGTAWVDDVRLLRYEAG